MTKIEDDDIIRIQAFREANWGYGKISNHLGYKRTTAAKHCQNVVALRNLPPQIKVFKGVI